MTETKALGGEIVKVCVYLICQLENRNDHMYCGLAKELVELKGLSMAKLSEEPKKLQNVYFNCRQSCSEALKKVIDECVTLDAAVGASSDVCFALSSQYQTDNGYYTKVFNVF